MESILNSTKKLLGVSEEDTNFDTDIIIHINSVFTILYQIGVGPKEVFFIVDETTLWDEFIPDYSRIFNDVKTYMYLKVKLLFDPPLSSSHLSAIKEQASELEWRLNVSAETFAQVTEEF